MTKCHLSPAQWLPKPATRQFPEKRRALRATWSPRGGEGEESAQRAAQGLGARNSPSISSRPVEGRGRKKLRARMRLEFATDAEGHENGFAQVQFHRARADVMAIYAHVLELHAAFSAPAL